MNLSARHAAFFLPLFIFGVGVVFSIESPGKITETAGERGEAVMKALALAYPKLVKDPQFMNNDWTVKLRGELFYYAGGRLLPENFLPSESEYMAQPFYRYKKKFEWKKPTAEEAERLRQTEAARGKQNGKRSVFFYDALWNIRNKDEAWKQVKTIRFLGKEVLVHHALLEPLAMVEQRINEEAKSSAKVAAWLKQIKSITGWNWRTIADVKSRSNHAYGTALDILPKTLSSLETYWLWTKQKNIDWRNVPPSRRYAPPEAVIGIFEDYGFIWGGKWAFYDTMHFEYRPEILIYNGIEMPGEW